MAIPLSSKDLSVKELIVRQISASRAALALVAIIRGKREDSLKLH